MRWHRWALGILAAAAVLYLYFAALAAHELVPDHPYLHSPGPWVIAHRGGEGLWPENTLFAFERADAIGVDVLDMDLHVTSDGVIVVMHDAKVDRTTNGTGRVDGMTFADIRKLDAGYRFENAAGQFPDRGRDILVPAFAEVLSRFDKARLNVEMKEFTPASAVRLCELIKESSATDRVMVASFPQDAMTAFRRSCPSVATSATLRESLLFFQLTRMYLGSLYRSPAVSLEVPMSLRGREVVDAKFLARARAFNLKVQVWTVNEEAEMKRLLDMGVQGILTDFPDRLLRLMGREKAGS